MENPLVSACCLARWIRLNKKILSVTIHKAVPTLKIPSLRNFSVLKGSADRLGCSSLFPGGEGGGAHDWALGRNVAPAHQLSVNILFLIPYSPPHSFTLYTSQMPVG